MASLRATVGVAPAGVGGAATLRGGFAQHGSGSDLERCPVIACRRRRERAA